MDIWSSYWQGPRLACTLTGSGIGYPESLVNLWQDYFKTFETGARLLDIGTGNGALAIMANDTARLLDRRFEIHASDRSDIDPLTHLHNAGVNLDGIVFHANAPAERMEFPAAYFDAVTGQFALEYTDMARTVTEVARILKPEGRVRFVLHMRGGNVYEQTRRQLEDIRLIQDEWRLLDKANAMMTAFYACEKDENAGNESFMQAREAKKAFFEAAKRVHAAVPEIAYKELYSDLLEIIAYYWNNRRRTPLEEFLTRSEELKTEISMARRRHMAMCERSLDSAGIEALQSLFRHNGFTPPLIRKLRMDSSSPEDYFAWDLSTRLSGSSPG